MADIELANTLSCIALTPGIGDGSDKGVAYAEEYFTDDKVRSSAKTVYVKEDTQLALSLNSYVTAMHSSGQIKMRIGGDLHYSFRWANEEHNYTAPFALEDLEYASGVPVVGTTGGNGEAVTSRTTYKHRGVLDEFGDEWHFLAVALYLETGTDNNEEYWASQGAEYVLCVNPKTPNLTVRPVGSGQFLTTEPRFHFNPRMHTGTQTTYFTGTCTFEIRDINGNNVFYRIVDDPEDAVTSYTAAGANNVTLDQDDFALGEQYLQYYYAGNTAVKPKHRKIVKKGTAAADYPSYGEGHGNLLFGGNEALYAKFQSNIADGGIMQSWWTKLRTDDSHHATSATTAVRAAATTSSSEQNLRRAQRGALACSLLVKQLGYGQKANSTFVTFEAGAKSHLLNNILRIVHVGIEQAQNGAYLPSREIKDRGYYTVGSRGFLLDVIFAYDEIVANCRADQVAGGITVIEDHFIRECLAKWAMFCMMEVIGGYANNEATMWGTCRCIAAQAITLAMPSYSSPHYGTSGWDGNTTTYTGIPFPDQGLTWKQAFIDADHAIPGYPNAAVRMDYDALFTGPEGTTINGVVRGQGHWKDRMAYLEQILCGWPLGVLAMMAKLHTGKVYPNLFAAIQNLKRGQIYATKKGSSEADSFYGPHYVPFAFADNRLFPEYTEEHLAWWNGRSDSRKEDYLKYGSAFTMAYFDANFQRPAATPEFSPSPVGTKESLTDITITCADEGATIYYTTDGTDPTTSSTLYTAPFEISVDTTVKAFAVHDTLEDSEIGTATYDIDTSGKPAAPTGLTLA